MQLEHGWNGNSRRKRPSATPSSRFLHRLHTKLQRCLPLLQLLAVGIVCLAAGLLGGIVLHKRLGSTHIYCTTQPYFASSKQDVECEAWAARQQSVIATRVERQLPAHCMGIPYLSQITQDLSPWVQQGVVLEAVEAAAREDGALRLVLVQGQLWAYGDYESTPLHARFRYYVEFLQKMLCAMGPAASALTVDFVVNLKDECRSPIGPSTSTPLPIMSAHKSAMFYDVLFPFPEFYRDWDDVVNAMRKKATAWENKKDLLVWRGSQTGGQFTSQTWRSFPRARLVLLCKEQPHLCDAAWSEWTQVDAAAKKEMQQEFHGLGNFISLQDQQQYRYIASLDGNGWATRFAPLLSSSSAVFKQTSPWYEFFYTSLRPFEHYIPLSQTLDDAADVIHWARNNTAVVRQIITNANTFVDRWLTTECIHCYALALLHEYQTLLQFNVSTQGARLLPHVCHTDGQGEQVEEVTVGRL